MTNKQNMPARFFPVRVYASFFGGMNQTKMHQYNYDLNSMATTALSARQIS
jgi:hypothetical protein